MMIIAGIFYKGGIMSDQELLQMFRGIVGDAPSWAYYYNNSTDQYLSLSEECNIAWVKDRFDGGESRIIGTGVYEDPYEGVSIFAGSWQSMSDIRRQIELLERIITLEYKQ